MPANLTPEYLAAEERFKKSKTAEEKLEALEAMLRTIPKHKGTEKMRADIKRRISKTKGIIEQKKSSGKKGISYHIPKEGCAQITLVGPPNTGKSSIVGNFTGAPTVIGDYPYSTIKPQPGMLFYENIAYQLVDLPPISAEFLEPWVPSLIRVCDVVLLTIGLDDISQLDIVIQRLHASKIRLTDTFSEANYYASEVVLPALIIANKSDHHDAQINLELLKETYTQYRIVPLSSFNPSDANLLGRELYDMLQLIRVYTQAPGKEPRIDQPIVLRKGAVLLDAAQEIHKDFAHNLKYARVWGKNTFDGQRVQRDYVLNEGDIIEFKL
ncbi:TGS domain-containing protein [bacterium]|nr:TGS domain-containing protein [candidate division CSSED10-310 bacterium]